MAGIYFCFRIQERVTFQQSAYNRAQSIIVSIYYYNYTDYLISNGNIPMEVGTFFLVLVSRNMSQAKF